MPAWLGALGMQAAGNAVNAGMGMALGAYNDRRQLKQQKKLNDLENQRAMEMWENTNYKAQVEQLKKAGMNPGLLYGMGGAGGATMGHAGQNAPSGGAEMGMMKGAGAAELALLAAQTENVKADTENKKAEKPVKEATVPNIQADTQTKTLNNEFLKKSMEDRIDIINTEAGQKIEELIQAQGNTQVNRQTIMARTDLIIQQAVGEQIKNALMEEQTKATGQNIEESKKRVQQMDAQINNWSQQLAQGWTGLSIQEQDMRIRAFSAEFQANHPGLWNVLGGAIQRLANKIAKPLEGLKVEKK